MEQYKKGIIIRNIIRKLRLLEETGNLAIKHFEYDDVNLIEVRSIIYYPTEGKCEKHIIDFEENTINKHFKNILKRHKRSYCDCYFYEIDCEKAKDLYYDVEEGSKQESFYKDCERIKQMLKDSEFSISCRLEYRYKYLIVHTIINENRLTDAMKFHELLLKIMSLFPKFYFTNCELEKVKQSQWDSNYYMFNYSYED